jgi:MFS family permease
MSDTHPIITIRGSENSQAWITLSGIMVLSVFSVGIFAGTFGVFLPVICQDFGWNRAELSLAFSLSLLAFGLPSALWGLVINRMGPRFCILTGNLVMVLGFAGLFFIQEIWQVYLLYILIGFGAGFGCYLAPITLIRRWFSRKSSLPLGIFTAGASLGVLIFALVASLLISFFSWRNAFLIQAAIILTGLIIAFILVKNKPSSITEESGEEKSVSKNTERREEGNFKQVFRLPATWVIVFFTIAYAFSPGLINTQLVAYLQDIGFTPIVAATTLSMVSGIGVLGSLLFGVLALKYSARYLTIVVFGLQITGYIILLVSQNLVLIYLASGLEGIAIGALTVAVPILVGVYHKQEHYTFVLGIASAFVSITQALAATASGAIHDATGTYIIAFIVAGSLGIVGIINIWFAHQPSPS